MQEAEYYYSVDGTETMGPVNRSQLGILHRQGVLTAAGWICPVGETNWQAFRPELFPASGTPSPAPPVFRGPNASTTESRRSRRSSRTSVVILRVIFVLIVVVAGAVFELFDQRPVQDVPYRIGAITGSCFFLGLIPYLVSLPFKGLTRGVIRVVLVSILAFLVLLGQSKKTEIAIFKTAKKFREETQVRAQDEIKKKGYFEGDINTAESHLDQMREQATGDSEAARLTRDVLAASASLIPSVKAAQTMEKSIDFKAATVTNEQDLADREAALTKLHDLQADVVTALQNFDKCCRDALTADNFSGDKLEEIIRGAHKGAHVEDMVLLWQAQMKLADDHAARFELLRQNWGGWEMKDGKILFKDSAKVEPYNDAGELLHADVQQIGEIQKRIFQ